MQKWHDRLKISRLVKKVFFSRFDESAEIYVGKPIIFKITVVEGTHSPSL